MPHEGKKDLDAMLHDSKDMPESRTTTDQKSMEKCGGGRMFFAPPIDCDRAMRQVPCGKAIAAGKIRERFGKMTGTDLTDPVAAGIFVSAASFKKAGQISSVS